MKLILIIFIFFVPLFSQTNVAKFAEIDGTVYVLRYGKMLKAYNGLKLYERDVIYSNNFSKSEIIFPNNFIYKISGKKTLNVKTIMDTNPSSKMKTTKQLRKDSSKNNNLNDYKHNSKFYKQRDKVQKRELQKKKEAEQEEEFKKEAYRQYIDKRRGIYVESHTKNISNIADGKDSHVNIGSIIVDPKSSAKSININGNSENVNNYSKGRDNRGSVGIGNINVQ